MQRISAELNFLPWPHPALRPRPSARAAASRGEPYFPQKAPRLPVVVPRIFSLRITLVLLSHSDPLPLGEGGAQRRVRAPLTPEGDAQRRVRVPLTPRQVAATGVFVRGDSAAFHASNGRYSTNADRPTISTIRTVISTPLTSVSRKSSPSTKCTGCCWPWLMAMFEA